MLKKVLLSLLLIAANCHLFAQIKIDYSDPKEYEIGGIEISGVRYSDHGALISLSGLQVGQKVLIPGSEITRAVDKLWKQGLFSDVKIRAKKIEGGKIYLEIYMQERPRLSQVNFEGARKGQIEDIEEAINLIRGTQVTAHVLNNTKKIITQYYIEKGYRNAEITITQRDDSTLTNTVILDIEIDKKSKIKIEDIVFHGNEKFPDKKLRRTMKETKRKTWWNIFKASKLIEKTFEEDLQSVVALYQEFGYRDMRVVKDTVYVAKKNRIKIEVTIDEGNPYYFRNINWVGNSQYSTTILSKALQVNKGDVYDKTFLMNRLTYDLDAVSSIYLDNGYLFFHVDPIETAVENDSVDIEMRIYEGKQAEINKIIITGNSRTNEHVVRRELYTKPGDLFRRSNIQRTIQQLAQLGHFDPEKLDVRPIPNPTDGTVDLEYILEERSNDQIEISGGWGADMVVGTIGLRFNNFSTRNFFNKDAWRPLPTGDGQQLSLRAQSNGTRYQSYSLSFVEPWLGGKKPNSLSVSTYYTVQTNGRPTSDPERTSMTITGVALGLGRRLQWPDDYFTLYHEISYQKYLLSDWNYFIFSNGTSNNLSFKTVLSRNSFDKPLYTRNGSSVSLTLQFTPPFSLINGKDYTTMSSEEKYKWIEYHKWKVKADWFTTLIGDLVFHTKAEYGFLGYYNNDIGHSPFEGFNLGGDGLTGYSLYGRETIGLRGYENNSLTPTEGANTYAKYTAEVRYPLSLNPSATVYVMVFAEAGNAWSHLNRFDPFNVKRSAGVGIRLFLPMLGLIGLDWAYGYDDVINRPGVNGSQFHFVLGQQF